MEQSKQGWKKGILAPPSSVLIPNPTNVFYERNEEVELQH
jgi:hypothetical protein